MSGTSNGKNVGAEKKRRNGFNFVDLTLIVVLMVLVAVLVYVFSPVSWVNDLLQGKEKTINYTVEFTNVDATFVNSVIDGEGGAIIEFINEGDDVIDSVTKSSIGKVTTKPEKEVYVEYEWIAKEEEIDGEKTTTYLPNKIDYPDRYNVRVTITVNANYYEGRGYFVDSTRIAVGEKISMRFPRFVGEGYCIGISG